jgi:hypothetical protein
MSLFHNNGCYIFHLLRYSRSSLFGLYGVEYNYLLLLFFSFKCDRDMVMVLLIHLKFTYNKCRVMKENSLSTYMHRRKNRYMSAPILLAETSTVNRYGVKLMI